MKKTFRSKVNLKLLFPLSVVLAIGELYLLLNRIWPGAVLVALVSLFILYLYKETFYELTGDNKLRIRSGFLYNKVIYVKSIKKVRSIRNLHASPALSPDRLEIQYNRYDRVQISPTEKTEFIHQLKQVNPRIMVM